MPRLFTLDEASALLPEIRAILVELRREVERLDEVAVEAATVRDKIRQNGHATRDEPLSRQRAAREAIGRQIARLNELGVELKDPRTGLIDFPSRRDGDIVYLCWKLDEPTIAFWHPTDTGFAGRRPL
jgi:hypothetical protein